MQNNLKTLHRLYVPIECTTFCVCVLEEKDLCVLIDAYLPAHWWVCATVYACWLYFIKRGMFISTIMGYCCATPIFVKILKLQTDNRFEILCFLTLKKLLNYYISFKSFDVTPPLVLKGSWIFKFTHFHKPASLPQLMFMFNHFFWKPGFNA